MEAVDATQLLDGALVILDAKVDDDVGQRRVATVALNDEEGRGLLAAPVASGRLRRGEAFE